MGKKNKNKRKQNTGNAPEQSQPAAAESGRSDGGGVGRLVAIGLLVLGGGFFTYAILGGQSSSSSSGTVIDSSATTSTATPTRQSPERRFRYYDSPEAAKPLPVTLPPTNFMNQGIANTYAIAKDIPEVLAQQPCLCGCDRSDDHASLLDCFADEHASTCAICMKEAVLAKQMTEAGEAASQIREAILRHEYSNVSIGN